MKPNIFLKNFWSFLIIAAILISMGVFSIFEMGQLNNETTYTEKNLSSIQTIDKVVMETGKYHRYQLHHSISTIVSAKEMSAQVEEVTASVQVMANLSKKLQQVVGQFRL